MAERGLSLLFSATSIRSVAAPLSPEGVSTSHQSGLSLCALHCPRAVNEKSFCAPTASMVSVWLQEPPVIADPSVVVVLSLPQAIDRTVSSSAAVHLTNASKCLIACPV